jgi:hypothetical protein
MPTLTEQDITYVVQVIGTRPLNEALPLYLKLTGQQLVPVAVPPPPLFPLPPPDPPT